LAFPSRLDIVAASWGILALGDGVATLVGRTTTINAKPAEPAKTDWFARFAFPVGALPWNRDKTIAGTLAFVVCGGLAGVALAWWTRPAVAPPPPMTFTIVAPLVAAIVAAFAETVPVRLDDNITVSATAGAVLWLACV